MVLNPISKPKFPWLWILLFLSVTTLSEATRPTQDSNNQFLELSLEQLMELEVVSASKKSTALSKTTAAVFVITQEDIRRSGVTAIPEVLRMVPGLEVAHITSNQWAITSRGFNDAVARKLLVMVDGQSVYTGLFSGTFWDTLDTALEDIERIEVIRGPGGALWGANAVNGVINIITQKSSKTQGTLVTAGGGNVEQGFGTLRYGGKVKEGLNYRVYGKAFVRSEFEQTSGTDNGDNWHQERGGFRVDWKTTEHSHLTVLGDIYTGDSKQNRFRPLGVGIPVTPQNDEVDVSGAHLLTRWEKAISSESNFQAQFYYTQERRMSPLFGQDIHILDWDIQHHFVPHNDHQWTWGINARVQFDELTSTFLNSFNPETDTNDFVSLFFQDDITLIDNTLILTLGTKIGHNSYTGFEYQPNARLLWTPHSDWTFWAAVSRAVRTPSRLEDSFRLNFLTLPGGPPSLFSTFGNSELKSEDLLAYEAGFRSQVTRELFIDVAGSFNVYDDLVSSEPLGTTFDPALGANVTASQFSNQLEGETWGGEIAVTWQAAEFWKLRAGFNYLQMNLFRKPGSQDTAQITRAGNSPEFQYNLRSYLDLPYNLELDLGLNYVDELSGLNVDSYFRLDGRIGWNPTKNLELSLVGRSLLENDHQEYNGVVGGILPVSVPRSVYFKVTWKM